MLMYAYIETSLLYCYVYVSLVIGYSNDYLINMSIVMFYYVGFTHTHTIYSMGLSRGWGVLGGRVYNVSYETYI